MGPPKKRTYPVCRECGSRDVKVDAYAVWDMEKQDWVVSSTYPAYVCEDCDGECSIDWRK